MQLFWLDYSWGIFEMEGTTLFSFGESCVRAWEGHRDLRKRAIKGIPLLVGETESGDDEDLGMQIPQSLANIRLNYTLLKAYTKHMAQSGIVVTKHVDLLKEPVTKFYELMEIDVDTPAAKAVCQGQTGVIKKMLGVVKRKWSRWEMPRAPRLYCFFLIFIEIRNWL